MQALKSLIDEALKVCKTQTELAKRLSVSTSLMSAMAKGERSITWPHAALLAEMTGHDPEEAIKAALIAETPMLKNGAKLREILGKGRAVGGVAMLDSSYSADTKIDTAIVKNRSDLLNKNIHRIYQMLSRWKKRIQGEFSQAKTGLLPQGLSL